MKQQQATNAEMFINLARVDDRRGIPLFSKQRAPWRMLG
jgi:hypothetical protein